MFALHDPASQAIDALIVTLGLPVVLEDVETGHQITGPLSPDQATILASVASCTDALALIHPEAPLVDDEQQEYADGGEAAVAAATEAMDLDGVRKFVETLSETLGVDCTVEDGVIVVGEAPCPMVQAVQALAAQGVQPDDFLCMTAAELLLHVHEGLQLSLIKDCDGFYVSDDVAKERELGAAHEPVSCENIPEGTIQLADGRLIYPAPIAGAPELPEFEQRVASPFAEREDILLDAASTVTDGRNTVYGEPEDALALIASYWSVYTGLDLNAEDVAMMMALLKIARAEGAYKRDNYIDAAGYVAIAGEAALAAVTDPFNPNGKTVH